MPAGLAQPRIAQPCTSGPLSVTQGIVATYENNAQDVTASLSSGTATDTATPADYIVLNWATNLTTCTRAVFDSRGADAPGFSLQRDTDQFGEASALQLLHHARFVYLDRAGANFQSRRDISLR